MVLPALSRPRRRTEYSVVGRVRRSARQPSTSACAAVLFTFFASRVSIQRLGQVIHDRKIKTDATKIVEPRQSWEV